MMSLKQRYERTNNPARQYLPAGYMQHMPFKTVTAAELYDLKCNMDFNPLYEYPKSVKPRKGEVGHDQAYRYKLKGSN